MLRRAISDVGETKTGVSSRPVPTLGGFARTLMSRVSTGKSSPDDDNECDLSPNSIRQLMFLSTRAKSTHEISKENFSPESEEERASLFKVNETSIRNEAERVDENKNMQPPRAPLPEKILLGPSGQIQARSYESNGLRKPVRTECTTKVDKREEPTVVLRDPVRAVQLEAQTTKNEEAVTQKPLAGVASSHGNEILSRPHGMIDSALASSVVAPSVRDPLDLSIGNKRASNLPPVRESSETPMKGVYIPESRKTPRGRDALKSSKSESCISIQPQQNEHKVPKRSPPLVMQGELDSSYKCAIRISGNPTPRRASAIASNRTPAELPPRPSRPNVPSTTATNHLSLPSRRHVKGIDLEALKHIEDTSADTKAKPLPEEWKIQVEGVQSKKYMVVRVLGKGGSGEVSLVVERTTKNLFALKKVNLAGMGRSIVEECVNEIEMLMRLKESDFVVRIDTWEINRAQQVMKIVMEYGQCDLAESLRKARFSLRQVQSTWERMLKIVAEIHRNGIVHSDLKPSNFVWVGHQLKIIDFGIASRLQNSDITSIAILNPKGTLNYISPETLFPDDKGKAKVGPKSDIWALGCILYLMVYGKTPFQDYEHYLAKANAISQGNIEYPPLPTEFMDSGVDSVLRDCFRMDHHERPSASDLLRHPFLVGYPRLSQ